MGKQIVQSAIWGIELDDAQALLIKNTLEPSCSKGCGYYLDTKSKYHIALKADDSGYGEPSSYNPDCEHVFGVVFCENQRAIKMPEAAKKDFELYVKPFLESLGVIAVPELLVISQVY